MMTPSIRANALTSALAAALTAAVPAFAQSPEAEVALERRSWAPLRDIRERLKKARREGEMELKLLGAHIRGAARQGFSKLEPDWAPRRCGEGSLELGPGGIPILRLRGTPEEMGRQHGLLLKKEIKVLVKDYLPSFLGSDYEDALAGTRSFEPYISTSRLAELKAMAEAAEVELAEILLGHTFADQYRAWACSCVTATGAARAEAGTPIFGRNLDFIDMGFLHRFSIVTVTTPAEGRRFVSMGFPGMAGVISGMNEDGLSAAVMVVHGDTGCRPGTPFSLLFREVLERCETVDEAEVLLRDARITVTNNLMVCAADGRARVFELFPGTPGAVELPETPVLTRGPDARGLLHSTNHFNAPARREARWSFVYLSSKQRYATLEKVCEETGAVELGTVKECLAKTAPAAANVQSMVFLPAEREVHVAFGPKPAAKQPFVRLSKEQLFGD